MVASKTKGRRPEPFAIQLNFNPGFLHPGRANLPGLDLWYSVHSEILTFGDLLASVIDDFGIYHGLRLSDQFGRFIPPELQLIPFLIDYVDGYLRVEPDRPFPQRVNRGPAIPGEMTPRMDNMMDNVYFVVLLIVFCWMVCIFLTITTIRC